MQKEDNSLFVQKISVPNLSQNNEEKLRIVKIKNIQNFTGRVDHSNSPPEETNQDYV